MPVALISFSWQSIRGYMLGNLELDAIRFAALEKPDSVSVHEG
jgi:hypothetical protein